MAFLAHFQVSSELLEANMVKKPKKIGLTPTFFETGHFLAILRIFFRNSIGRPPKCGLLSSENGLKMVKIAFLQNFDRMNCSSANPIFPFFNFCSSLN